MLIGEFWGTGAAEGIPAPFCRCKACMEARETGGHNRRLRSCFRLSDKIMLDLGADAVVQSIQYGDITDIEHVLITHTHEDHLNPHMLMEAMWSKEYRRPIHYYFTEESFEIVRRWRESPWVLKGRLSSWEAEGIVVFHQLEFGKCYEIEDMKVIPFQGNHLGSVESRSGMYLVELPDKRKLFYGLDSGIYFPETIQALQEHTIDIYITEASLGVQNRPHPYHMNLFNVRNLIGQLYDQGTLNQNSHVYVTHINHGSSHTEMLECSERLQFPVPTTIAWDGMKIL